MSGIDVFLQELARTLGQGRGLLGILVIGLELDLPRALAFVSELSGEIRAVDLTRDIFHTVTVLDGAETGIALG